MTRTTVSRMRRCMRKAGPARRVSRHGRASAPTRGKSTKNTTQRTDEKDRSGGDDTRAGPAGVRHGRAGSAIATMWADQTAPRATTTPAPRARRRRARAGSAVCADRACEQHGRSCREHSCGVLVAHHAKDERHARPVAARADSRLGLLRPPGCAPRRGCTSAPRHRRYFQAARPTRLAQSRAHRTVESAARRDRRAR